MDDLGRALTDDHPLSLLAQASTLLAVVDPRNRDPFERPGEGPPRLDWDVFLATLFEVERRETTALLTAFVEMTPDELAAARIRRELATRDDLLPSWLVGLSDVEAYRAVEMVHVLGDGDNVMLGVRFPAGHELTVVVYIDHNLGTVVKDAFVVPGSVAELIDFMREKSDDDPDTVWDDLDAADARARITEGIEAGAMTVPRFETDTWPACRPLVEWIARLLPSGGRGYVRPEWDDDAQAALTARFLASPFAAGLDDDQVELLDQVLWFATGYGPGDPLRWSPVAVELLLVDWIPRKIVAGASYLSKAPDLLRAFIAFCHAERGIRPLLTEQTLAAVDHYEPEYQRTIRSPRPQGPEALLAAMGVLDPDGPWAMPDDEPLDYRELMLDTLRRAVGGEAALDDLDDRSLPNEDFDWNAIPPDIRATVDEVLVLCDRCCDELLDGEYRTACRRFLTIVASGDPSVFRRRARTDTAAAAVCWIIGKANALFTPSGGGLLVKDLMAHFGLHQGGVSQRATTMLRAGGFSTDHYRGIDLATPELLVSSRRRSILEHRDRYRSLLDDG